MTTRWVPVPGYEGLYEVSSEGQVRSTRRKGAKGGLLRQALAGGRAPRLCVVLHKNGVRKTWLVGTLVNIAFHGPRPPGQVTRHGPAGALDNHETNVCWGTEAENHADMERDGTVPRGERSGTAKLTEAAVAECRLRYAAGERLGTLAAEFAVDAVTLSNAVSGRRWGWLPGAVPVDPKRHGKQGIAHHAARLTPEIVLECRARYMMGEKQRDLAAEYGVTQPTMQKALTGSTWQNLGALPSPGFRSRSRLTRETVFECRARYFMGEKQSALAAEYGVSSATMSQAVSGRTWGHI